MQCALNAHQRLGLRNSISTAWTFQYFHVHMMCLFDSPNLLVRVAAQPLHENIGVEAVGGTAQKFMDGVRVVLLHITHLLWMW